MKHVVKVGKEFAGQITVVIVNGESSKKEEFSWKKAGVVVAVALILSTVVLSVAYGFATGDYSVVKSLAEAGKNALEAAIKLVAKT